MNIPKHPAHRRVTTIQMMCFLRIIFHNISIVVNMTGAKYAVQPGAGEVPREAAGVWTETRPHQCYYT